MWLNFGLQHHTKAGRVTYGFVNQLFLSMVFYNNLFGCLLLVVVPLVPFDYPLFRFNQMRMEGFNVRRWANNWFDGINQIRDWVLEVKRAVFNLQFEVLR